MTDDKNNKLILFQNKGIRRTWFKEDWYYSLIDIVGALTDSSNPTDYLKKMRKRDAELGSYIGTNCPHVEMLTHTNKKRNILAGNIKDVFRLIQTISSPKAEPFKRWLAKVGYERLEEIENPELATKRMREIYKQKGYSDEWIEKRARGIAVRDELTEEWKKRGVKEHLEYAILTAEISKATFGMTPSEYKNFKALDKPKDNLRDHMTDLELIFTMLGEASTTEIAKKKDAKGYPENKKAVNEGGTIAGNARKELEEKSGTKVSTKTNYNELPEAQIRKKQIQFNQGTSINDTSEG
ncbi:MAG TPA: phage antirepressor protein [Methanosarcinaceae archaeon]|nr:phage antirepressor protein [Methanosarcinaceae archaeon]